MAGSTTGRVIISLKTGKKGYYICVLCDKEYNEAHSWAHNAEPIKEGKCCSLCNDTKVIPARLRIFAGKSTLVEEQMELYENGYN